MNATFCHIFLSSLFHVLELLTLCKWNYWGLPYRSQFLAFQKLDKMIEFSIFKKSCIDLEVFPFCISKHSLVWSYFSQDQGQSTNWYRLSVIGFSFADMQQESEATNSKPVECFFIRKYWPPKINLVWSRQYIKSTS